MPLCPTRSFLGKPRVSVSTSVTDIALERIIKLPSHRALSKIRLARFLQTRELRSFAVCFSEDRPVSIAIAPDGSETACIARTYSNSVHPLTSSSGPNELILPANVESKLTGEANHQLRSIYQAAGVIRTTKSRPILQHRTISFPVRVRADIKSHDNRCKNIGFHC